jgi:glycosyltransferase involved in cell wall biosynthesis
LFDTADELFDKIANVLKDRETYMAASAFARKYSENYFLQDHLDEYTLLYTTEYGDPKRKENATFLKNNPNQFGI